MTKKAKFRIALRQWVVDQDGMDTCDGAYYIEARRLSEPHWICHMAEKIWVDINDFIEAYLLACHIHRTLIDPISVSESILRARWMKDHSEMYDKVGTRLFPVRDGRGKLRAISVKELQDQYNAIHAHPGMVSWLKANPQP